MLLAGLNLCKLVAIDAFAQNHTDIDKAYIHTYTHPYIHINNTYMHSYEYKQT